MLLKIKTFALSLFCFHQLGYGNMKWGLMQDEGLKKLFDTFEVSNNIIEKWYKLEPIIL